MAKKRKKLKYPVPEKPPRRWVKIVLLVLLLIVIGGEYAASRALATKLRATAENKLDAQLRLGPVVYIPPYGAWIWNAQLVRNEQTIVSVGKARVSLAEFPLGHDKPIIISSLTLNAPAIDLAPGALKDIIKNRGAGGSKKVSDVLRLKTVRIFDGRVSFCDPRAEVCPMSWDGLTVSIDTTQQSPSAYTFHVMTRAQLLADASAAGTIDVDSLDVGIDSMSIKLHAEPEPIKSPFPQPVQQVLKDFAVSGTVAIDGNGKFPLRNIQQASFNGTVALQNAIASLPQNINVDHARVSAVVHKPAGGAVNVRIDKIDVAGEGKTLLVDSGQLQVDPSDATWQLTNVEGSVTIVRPPGYVPTKTAPSTDPTVSLHDDDPTLSPRQKFERYQVLGRADFSAAASGPLRIPRGADPWQVIQHEVVLYPRGMSFVPKFFFGRIEDVRDGEIRLKNGMIVCQDLSGKYGEDDLRLRSARLDVHGLPKLAQWQEMSGTVTFHQRIPRYSVKLDKIFNALHPDGPFLIAGAWTVDKRPDTLAQTPDVPDIHHPGATTRPLAKHTYDLIVSSDTGSFLLTDRAIPLSKIRGDASVTPSGVDIHALQAECMGGKISAAGKWVRYLDGSGNSDYDGQLTVRGVNITELQRLRNIENHRMYRGRLYGQANLNGTLTKGAPPGQNLSALRAAGEIEIVDGELFTWPVLKEIFASVGGMKQVVTAGDAAAVFEVSGGVVRLRNAAVNAPALGVQGSGKISMLDKSLDLNVVVAPLADWRQKFEEMKIPLISDVGGHIAGGIQQLLNGATGTLLYQFRIGGQFNKVEISAVPAPVLTKTASYVFSRMLAPKKNQRPLDWFEREAAGDTTRDNPQAQVPSPLK